MRQATTLAVMSATIMPSRLILPLTNRSQYGLDGNFVIETDTRGFVGLFEEGQPLSGKRCYHDE